RIISAVEHRQLSNGTARAIDGQHLLAAAGRALKNTQMALLNYKEAGTHFTFAEDKFSRTVIAGDGAFGQKLEFRGSQVSKDTHLPKSLQRLWFNTDRHAAILRSRCPVSRHQEPPMKSISHSGSYAN